MVLIGRQHELAVLGEALQRASGGETARLLLEGPLGSGTTSLLDELQTRLSGMPEVVMCRGRAYVPRSGLAYSALADALGGVLTALPDDRLRRVLGASTADMARLLPDLADRFGALTEPPEEAPRRPTRWAHACRKACSASSSGWPPTGQMVRTETAESFAWYSRTWSTLTRARATSFRRCCVLVAGFRWHSC